MTIWKARDVQTPKSKLQSPGEILEAKGDELIVSCGNHSVLKILELQIEGKRRISVRDFLNGIKISVGEILG